MDERELLREYAKTGSDAAFEQLVSRYVNLVYSAALRQLRDPHLAEDVLQAVFIILSKKAASLPRNIILPAWLLETTRLAALDALRTNARRQRREWNAAMSPTPDSNRNDPTHDMLPLLDEALAQLSASDRSALVLRFFEQRSLREVGDALAVSQSAADKRISRALERMRLFFANRGVIMTVAALAMALPASAVIAAPVEVAARIPAALAKAKAGLHITSAHTIAQNALQQMALAKIKTAVLWAAAAIIIGVAATIALQPSFNTTPSTPVAQAPAPPPEVNPVVPLPAEPERKTIVDKVEAAPVGAPPDPVPPPPALTLEEALAARPLRVPQTDAFVTLTDAIDPEADVINGEFLRENGVLSSNRALHASIEVPYYPPREYDLRLTFTPIQARDSISIMLVHGPTTFVYKMGGYGNQACLFEVANQPWPMNKTAFKQRDILRTGETMTCVVEVRDTGVRAFLNEHLVCDLPTDYKNLGLWKQWAPRHPGVLGLGTWGTPVQFNKLEIAEISGQGRWLRAPGVAAARPPADPLPDDAQWRTATNLLAPIDAARDCISGAWSRNETELTAAAFPHARIYVPYQPPEEYDLRVVLARKNGAGEVAILLPRGKSAVAWKMFLPEKMVGFASVDDDLDKEQVNHSWCYMPDIGDDGTWTAILRVRKAGVRVWLNGKLMSNLPNNYPKLVAPPSWQLPDRALLGLGSDRSETVFKSIELLPVTGEGKAVTQHTQVEGLNDRF